MENLLIFLTLPYQEGCGSMPVLQEIIRVYGIVQGVGFRPFVSRAATKNNLFGSVCNKGPYVEIVLQGTSDDIDNFKHELKNNPPERSSILKIDARLVQEWKEEYTSFEIIESEKEKGDIFVSPDIGICPKCKKELFDKRNRRYLHPFINCTSCGPRLTILDSMPYDRVRTSMGKFEMCDECNYEYTHAETRRYDAQPVCCNSCGPKVYIIDSDLKDREAISYARRIISQGGIIAVKGIGGFHLCADATNEEAVSRLRQLKTRPSKPFAVMMKDMETIRQECIIEGNELDVIDGYQKPIILLKKKENGLLCRSVAPDNPYVGVMLPYAPLQLLLFTYDDGIRMPDSLVMTSGNVSGAPICRNDEDAVIELSGMCDAILSNDRDIRIRADDSVMSFYKNKPYMIRRSRGYAPLPFMLTNDYKGKVLAIGGELKNTFCIGKDDLFYQSPYVGDMADLRTVKSLEETVKRMEELLETKPTVVACDMHTKYNTVLVAKKMGLPVIEVQHHYAHIVSCMAENDYSDKVIGVSFDGTGYGTDKTVWGGEILIADYDGFDRVASIRPFKQIGGDISAKEGYRIAASMLYGIYKDKEKTGDIVNKLKLCKEDNLKVIMGMYDNNLNSVISTSAGRLFDAVSAVLGIKLKSSFEGEASTMLEFAARRYTGSNEFLDFKEVPLFNKEEKIILNTDLLFENVLKARLGGEEIERIAYYFHFELSKMITAACISISKERKINTVALSGGVFQNRLLLELCENILSENNLKVLRHSLIPPNDGGIALGQAVVAMKRIQNQEV